MKWASASIGAALDASSMVYCTVHTAGRACRGWWHRHMPGWWHVRDMKHVGGEGCNTGDSAGGNGRGAGGLVMTEGMLRSCLFRA